MTMILDQFSRNDTLYVLAVPSWVDWIIPFLSTSRSAGPNFVCWEPGTPPPIRLQASLTNNVVLLSHHVTLLRDAQFAFGKSNVLAQPEAVAALAHDKVAMGTIAATVPSLRPIPSFTLDEALAYLYADQAHGVIVKHRGGTEGKGFGVRYSADQLRKDLEGADHSALLLQPALEGVEYSVNLITDGKSCRTYEPVSKGSNRGFTTHPAKRLRTFPAPIAGERARELMKLAEAYALAIGARGLLEVEFLETDEGAYLMEVNPRLSATLRMCIAASNENLLLGLSAILDGNFGEQHLVKPTARSIEIPLPSSATRTAIDQLFRLGNVQISSRVTLTAETPEAVEELRLRATRILREESLAVDA